MRLTEKLDFYGEPIAEASGEWNYISEDNSCWLKLSEVQKRNVIAYLERNIRNSFLAGLLDYYKSSGHLTCEQLYTLQKSHANAFR
jgi:hypothetical protein